MKPRQSHIFERDENNHYVEERWCSMALFKAVHFYGPILDPCCGWGRILQSAASHGFEIRGTDIVRRRDDYEFPFATADFTDPRNENKYRFWGIIPSIVCNPPFDLLKPFYERAMALTAEHHGKVAMIWPARRLAAAKWLRETPLASVLYMNPRPSMPTGAHISAGGKVGGGTQDFCWLIWEHGRCRPPEIGWLVRDEIMGS